MGKIRSKVIEIPENHKSGYVNIVGNPNVGKSTLMNALVGDKMSIITSKPQTTRHRILGIINGDDFQMIVGDSPGIIADPSYGMQKSMNKFAFSSFEDADIILMVTEKYEKYEGDEKVVKILSEIDIPKALVINKMDQTTVEEADAIEAQWREWVSFDQIFRISALEKVGVEPLLEWVQNLLPLGPAYYPKDQISDRPERFFASEIIRQHLLEQYRKEVPYSCEVVIQSFKESEKNEAPFFSIMAEIYVDRKSQKGIIIGHKGEAIKKLGTAARVDLEAWFGGKVFLELLVKVKDNWRDDDKLLKHFGYQ